MTDNIILAVGKAHQRVIREQKEKEDNGETWKHLNRDIGNAVIKPITNKLAKEIVEEYEWLGCMPAISKYCFGIVCVHWAHPHSGSKLIMESIKQLPPEYDVITCTIDKAAGEVGTIYQACNFYYIGSMRGNNPKTAGSAGRCRFGVKIDGKIYGSRAMRSKVGSQKKADILARYPQAIFIKQYEKHRYFYFRGSKNNKKHLKKGINDFIKPYPKRVDKE